MGGGAVTGTAGGRRGCVLSTVGPGSVLGSRYALRSRARGDDLDAVWVGYDQTLDRMVSVRVVPASHAYAEAMLDAARRAASVEDPRLLRVLDVGRDASVAFVVSEWVDAPTLADRLRTGPLPAELVRTVVGEAALALENVRHRGLHHLALLPEDIHVVDDETVKILGVAVHAALAGDDERDGERAGSRDTEGLVALAYAGLTGYWPLGTPSSLPAAPRVGSVPAPPSEVVSGVPADLDALCAQTFAGAGAPVSPGLLADEIAPWGRARRPVRGFPHPLTGATPAPDVPAEESRPAVDIDLRDGSGPTAPRGAAAGQRGGAPDGGSPRKGDGGVRRVLTDEAAEAAGLAGPLGGATPRPAGAAPRPRPVEATGTTGGPSRGAGPVSRTAPAVAAARAVLTRAAGSVRGATRPDTEPAAHESAPVRPRPAGAHGATQPTTPAAGRRPGQRTGGLGEALGGALGRRPQARGEAPSSGLATDLFEPDPVGAAEPAAPLLPPTPLSRPPRDQTRAVLALMAGFVAVFLLIGYCGLRGLGSSSGTPAVPRPTAAAPSATTPTGPTTAPATPSASPTAATAPVRIASVSGFDPEGDGAEKDSTAGDAFDGDPDTAWESETYRSDTYGGLKDGVGLLVDLGAPARVTSLTARLGGEGSSVELRTATGSTLDGSRVIATADDASGTVPLRAATAVTTRYLVLWFTTPARVDDGYRAVVDELSVR